MFRGEVGQAGRKLVPGSLVDRTDRAVTLDAGSRVVGCQRDDVGAPLQFAGQLIRVGAGRCRCPGEGAGIGEVLGETVELVDGDAARDAASDRI